AIFRVQSVRPTPAAALIEGLPGERLPRGLFLDDFAAGFRSPNDLRSREDQRAVTIFVSAQSGFHHGVRSNGTCNQEIEQPASEQREQSVADGLEKKDSFRLTNRLEQPV